MHDHVVLYSRLHVILVVATVEFVTLLRNLLFVFFGVVLWKPFQDSVA